MRRSALAGVLIAASSLTACAAGAGHAVLPVPPATTAEPGSSAAATVPPSEPVTVPASQPATVPATVTVPATSTSSTTAPDPAVIDFEHLRAAATGLVDGNLGVSVSVWRDGTPVVSFTSGRRTDGQPIDRDSQFVIASVSKLVTALSIARLAERGEIDVHAPVPWDAMGVRHDPAWDDVTVRQLLDHTSGMPEARATWLDDPGPCSIPLELAMAGPPTVDAGTWHYSNGNYCALGMLVTHVTGLDLDDAADALVFGPAGIDGPFLTTDGPRPTSVPYAKGLARLSRLGGAGTWMASPDDIAAVLSAVTGADLQTLAWPGIILDQYGWGHTGSVDGASTCAWVLQGGRTVVTAFVSGPRPGTGGKVCDRVVPALALDLGIWAGEPARTPD
jgi:CubicO group peptidase (beta-lactamase class C family)